MVQLSRRSFLQAGSASALAALTPGRHFTLAAQAAQAPTGEPIRFASIGCGIQGANLLRAAVTLPQARCLAAADLYDGRHTLAREIAGTGIRTTRSYRELLDDKQIEAVIIAVPDFAHKQVTLDALAAGKDVYCEKPMSHSIADGAAMVQAVQQGRNFVQVGSQRVSAPLFIQARQLFEAGAIGDLLQVELQLGRNSPGGAWEYPLLPDLSPATLDWAAWLAPSQTQHPFDPKLFHRWRCFRAYGTGMAGDLMVHLVSGMQFVTGLNAAPNQAFSAGAIARWPDGRDLPDVQTTAFLYGQVPVSVRLSLGTETPEMTRILGSHGVLEVSENAVTLRPQPGTDRSPDYGLGGWPSTLHAAYERDWHAEHDPALAAHPFDEVTVWHGSTWDDLHPHLANFFASVRTRKPPVEDVLFGHHAAQACHMANRSWFESTLIKNTA